MWFIIHCCAICSEMCFFFLIKNEPCLHVCYVKKLDNIHYMDILSFGLKVETYLLSESFENWWAPIPIFMFKLYHLTPECVSPFLQLLFHPLRFPTCNEDVFLFLGMVGHSSDLISVVAMSLWPLVDLLVKRTCHALISRPSPCTKALSIWNQNLGFPPGHTIRGGAAQLWGRLD